MPSFPDSIFLFVLALLLFGPKRLPVLARELGKWVGEFRRASNEFKMQMEDELRLSEQAERNKQIAAMEAAAPVTPPITATEPTSTTEIAAAEDPDAIPAEYALPEVTYAETPAPEHLAEAYSKPAYEIVDGVRTPLPIATSGDLKLMPPTTGLPTARTSNPLDNLLDAIPPAPEATPTETAPAAETTAETTAHGN
jgi:sec-independent protein translocase protein TatB